MMGQAARDPIFWAKKYIIAYSVDGRTKWKKAGKVIKPDVSDLPFKIIPPIEFTKPFAGQTLACSSTVNVSWNLNSTNPNIALIDLQYRNAALRIKVKNAKGKKMALMKLPVQLVASLSTIKCS